MRQITFLPERFGGCIPRSLRRNSSKAEQTIRNGQVVGSIPICGSKGYAQPFPRKREERGCGPNMTALHWYIVRLERLIASWLFRHYGRKIERSTPGKVKSLHLIQRPEKYMMRFHEAATGG